MRRVSEFSPSLMIVLTIDIELFIFSSEVFSSLFLGHSSRIFWLKICSDYVRSQRYDGIIDTCVAAFVLEHALGIGIIHGLGICFSLRSAIDRIRSRQRSIHFEIRAYIIFCSCTCPVLF